MCFDIANEECGLHQEILDRKGRSAVSDLREKRQLWDAMRVVRGILIFGHR